VGVGAQMGVLGGGFGSASSYPRARLQEW